ncbi:MAG: DUF362 domain-containing protein [Verrucomicrobiota bacterium]|nr:DUF362 domain-containing protein [Verrucomicrobiota bacterium]
MNKPARAQSGDRRPIVGVGGGMGPHENIRTALAAIDLSTIRGRTVLIKPNVGRIALPRSGINVSPEAVAACIDALREAGAARVAVGESPILGVNALEAFESAGVADVARERAVELLDLDRDRPVDLKLRQCAILPRVRLCRAAKSFDVTLSLAVMKTHMHTGVSLSIKNAKGMLYRRQKVAFHQLKGCKDAAEDVRALDVAISDFVAAFRPHIGVIDGWIGIEGLGPSAGAPKKANLAVASLDPVAADAVACRLMGIDPATIAHLRLAAEKGVGVLDLEKIRTVPPDLRPLVRPFTRPPAAPAFAFSDVTIYETGACSACLSTAMLFLQRYKDRLTGCRLEDGKLHLVLGNGAAGVPAGTIVIGNCAAKHRRRGPFAKGCPPVGSAIFKAATGRYPDEPDED